MPLEDADFISELDPTSPTGGEGVNQGDDHIRVTKKATQQSFENISGPVTATQDDLNLLTGAASGGSPLCVTGMIMTYMGIAAPNGWLLCDGELVPPEFTALITLIGANTPDLRGQFLRGISPDNSIDPDGPRAIGSIQADEFEAHTHTALMQNPVNAGAQPTGFTGGDQRWPPAETSPAGGDETRPKNIAFQFVIKT